MIVDPQWILYAAVGAGAVVGTAFSDIRNYFVRQNLKREHYLELTLETEELLFQVSRERSRRLRLEDSINETVEKRLRARLAEWQPEEGDIEDDYRKAEVMAVERETRDAGRFHPPVENEGEPARVSSISFSNPRSTAEGRNKSSS